MKLPGLFFLLPLALMFIQACDNKPAAELATAVVPDMAYDTTYLYDTRGYSNGEVFTWFDCPDATSFPPIDIKSWDKTPVVNGRLPTYRETVNGTSIHTYGGKGSPNVKPYPMTLPKLASCYKTVKNHKGEIKAVLQETVVVIQIVQTAQDTVVGYRYLTGGVGGSVFRDFHFLTDSEIKEAVEQ